MEEILEILEGNSRYTDEQIAVMAGKTVEEVREAIRDYEEKNIIAGYTTLINWENLYDTRKYDKKRSKGNASIRNKKVLRYS